LGESAQYEIKDVAGKDSLKESLQPVLIAHAVQFLRKAATLHDP
jgi:hypothetical protein